MVTSAVRAACQAPPPLNAAEILRRAIIQEEADEQALEQYAWHERDVVRQLQRDNTAGKLERDETIDVSQVAGVEYDRMIARNGQPLSPADQAKQDRKLAEFIRKQSSPQALAKNQHEQAKERSQRRELIEEVPRAFALELEPADTPPVCDCYVIRGTPLPGYHARDRNLDLLHHLAGTLWIDTHSFALVRVDLTIVQPVRYGLVLARIDKGGHLVVQDALVAGHWFPQHVTADLRARLLLVKGYSLALESSYSDYREFHTSIQIKVVK